MRQGKRPGRARAAAAALAFASAALAQDPPAPPPPVDLSGEAHASMDDLGGGTRGRDWFERVDVFGFVAGAYYHTEARGRWPRGAFVVDQASLFVEADVSEDVGALLELKFDEQPSTTFRTGETYVNLRRVAAWGDDGRLGVKLGRFDLPFGQYYLLQHAPDNPLVTYPAAMPYGVDEGVLAYGVWRGVEFAASVTEGHLERDSSQGTAPAVTARIGGDCGRGVHASASYLHIRETGRSAVCFSGIWLTPVGVDAPSTLGTSPSAGVRADLGVLDVRFEPGDRFRLRVSLGHGRLDDEVDAFDRDFTWFVLEPAWSPSPRWEVVGRWSEVGTYDDQEGLRFEGRPHANASADVGHDLTRLRRLSLGVRFDVTPALAAKLEVGIDHLDVIDVSPFRGDDRAYVAAQVVASF